MQQKLLEYENLVIDIYEEQGLNCLSGLDSMYLLNGKPLLRWHNDVTRKCAVKNYGHFDFSKNFDYSKNFDDILFCSDELLYFTALLFLYRPYINNPLEEADDLGNEILYPNIQNLYAKRYSMFADVASQKAYNFWDRVGAMIASFFPNKKINPRSISFDKVVNEVISEEFKNSPNYIWLANFRDNEYAELNRKRKEIVHYFTSDTDFKYNHLNKGVANKEVMEKLQAERVALADFYKHQISLTFVGLEKTLLLLEEISDVLYGDIV